MSTAIKRRRGSSVEHVTFAGLVGEITVDTSKGSVVIHDGSTAGGFALLREDASNYDGTEINNFRSQAIDDNSTNHTAQLILADGGILLGAPTGGVQGADTLNAEGLYVNGGAVAVKSANETISGDWTFTGTVTNVYSTNLNVSDNTITINDGEAGAGVTAGSAGFQVDRGSETDARLIFDEADDTWKIGLLGSELAIATASGMTLGDTSITLADTGSNGTITFTTDGTNALVLSNSQNATLSGYLSFGTAKAFIGAGNNAIQFHSSGGLTFTGQGSSDDFTFINDAGTTWLTLASGTTNASFAGNITVGTSFITQDASDTAGIFNVSGDAFVKLETSSNNLEIQAVGGILFDGTSHSFRSQDGTTSIFTLDTNGNAIVGAAQLADAATDGFLYIPSTTSGVPSGTPTSYSGRVPLVYDDTNERLYAYNGGWAPVGDGDGLAYAIAFS
jgi:hypothetical protein